MKSPVSIGCSREECQIAVKIQCQLAIRFTLILGERHLHRVLAAYVDYYNHARPHQGIDQQCPVSGVRSTARDGPIERRDILGGVLHDYYRRAA